MKYDAVKNLFQKRIRFGYYWISSQEKLIFGNSPGKREKTHNQNLN